MKTSSSLCLLWPILASDGWMDGWVCTLDPVSSSYARPQKPVGLDWLSKSSCEIWLETLEFSINATIPSWTLVFFLYFFNVFWSSHQLHWIRKPKTDSLKFPTMQCNDARPSGFCGKACPSPCATDAWRERGLSSKLVLTTTVNGQKSSKANAPHIYGDRQVHFPEPWTTCTIADYWHLMQTKVGFGARFAVGADRAKKKALFCHWRPPTTTPCRHMCRKSGDGWTIAVELYPGNNIQYSYKTCSLEFINIIS